MLLDLKFSILTLSITAGTFIAALYGMNLKNFIEESDLGFWGISAWCSVIGAAFAVYGLKKLRKVQRVSMWGHGSMISGTPRGAGWGLGAWGGRSTRLGECGDEHALSNGRLRMKPGETVGDLIQKERALSKRLAKVEAKTDDILRF